MSKAVEKMYRALCDHAAGLPEAWEDFPWGERVYKVRKKVFVFMGEREAKFQHLFLCVKLPASGMEVLRHDWAEPAGYGLGKSGWVYCKPTAKDLPSKGALIDWMEESYQAVAPKKLAKLLDG